MEEKCKEQFLVLRDGLAQMVKDCNQKLAVMDHETKIMHLDFDQVRMREHDLQTRSAGMQREIDAFRNQILVLTDLIQAHKSSVEEVQHGVPRSREPIRAVLPALLPAVRRAAIVC